MNDRVGRDLPRGWASAKIVDVVSPRTGKADPKAKPDARFIGMEQVDAHTMRLLGTVPASSMKSAASTFHAGDVLYGRLRAYLNKVYQPDFAGLCSGEFIVLQESSATHGRFLKYLLNSSDFVRFASQLNTGDRPRVDWDQIKNYAIGLPPRREQERIADALDELLSDLDAGAAALERVRAKLKHYRDAVLKAAVEGTLTTEWRRQHPATESADALLTRILTERRRRWEEAQLVKFEAAGKVLPKDWKAKYPQAAPPSATDLRALPPGWCWVSVDQLAWSSGYGTSEKCLDTNTGLPVLRIPNVIGGRLDLLKLKYARPDYDEPADEFVAVGDLLIVRTNGSRTLIGRGAVVRDKLERPLSFASYLIRLRLVPDPTMLGWVALLWESPLVRQWIEARAATSAGQHNISLSVLDSLPVPLPPMQEQAAIVDAVEDQLSVIDHLEHDLERRLSGARALRQSILRHAFTGRLVPQDPNDEPASELLKRITAEREERTRLAHATKQAKPRTRVSRGRAKKK